MEQLAQNNGFLKKILLAFQSIGKIFRRFFYFLGRIIKQTWNWLLVRLPFLASFIDRRINNPAAVFIDLAVLVLVIYVIFGALGAYLVYSKHSESKFTEDLALLYPLPAAKVSNNVIWAHEYLVRVRYINTFDAQAAASSTGTKPPTADQLRSQVMAGLIQNQVLVFEAKKLGVSVSTQEVNDAYNQQLKQTPDLATQINKLYGMSVNDFKEILAEQLLRQKVETAAVEQVRISQILVTTPDAANQAETDLKNGMSFTDAVTKYSQDAQTKSIGGDFGFWTKGELASQINQAYEDAAFSLPVGQISTPIQTQFGYFIIKVTSRTGTNYETFDDWYAGIAKNYKVSQYIK